MKILFIGDISGRPGRKTVKEVLPSIKQQEKPDIVIANCENAAGGSGVTREILDELGGYGIDFFTSGDHVFDVKDFVEEMHDTNLPLVRPYNYEGGRQVPGKGYDIIDMGSKGKLVVINILGQSFMREHVRNPFWVIDELLQELEEKNIFADKSTILVDFHAETTAEKVSFAYYVHDKVTAVVGTHTHVATADARLIGNTAFVTDVGMVGPLDASLWADFENIIHNFKFPFKKSKQMKDDGRRVFNSVLITSEQGRATEIKRVDRIIAE